jgi:hypothetical protein
LAEHPSCPFNDVGTVLIDRGDPSLASDLPAQPRCVAVACWTVGVAQLSRLSFMAEEEMAELLMVKDRTGGLSTDLLGGRNLHPWLAPLPIRGADRGCAAVARDRRIPVPASRAAVPALDFAQAVTNFERHATMEGVPASRVTIDSAGGIPVVYNGLAAA